MRYPVLVTFDGDGRLAALLQPFAEHHRWALRQARQPGACLRLLRAAGETVLVVRLGRDLDREFSLIERARALCPATAVIVVGDADHPRLAAVAWDLGAACVLFPPHPLDLLPAVVVGLLGVPEEKGATP